MLKEFEPNVFRQENFDAREFSNFLKRLSLKMLLSGGTFKALFQLISKFPQCLPDGKVNYLLASGLAVDSYIIGRKSRYHRDIDLVALNGWLDTDLHFRRIDVVRPNTFWNGLSFEDDFLVSSAVGVDLPDGLKVLIVHPAIILVQKSANRGDKPPRKKDTRDVGILLEKFSSLSREEKRSWWQIIDFSLNSFKDPSARQIAEERISHLKLTYE